MKKEILYLLEYLAKNPNEDEKALYALLLQTLSSLELYTPTKFTQAQIHTLMSHQGLHDASGFEASVKAFDDALDAAIPTALREAKQNLFATLLHANFPKKKSFLAVSLECFLSQLEPVEKSIYENLLAYVTALNRALGLFFVLGKEASSSFTPERLVLFGETLHVKLLENIFHEEERVHVRQGLKELLGVYLSLYGTYLYMSKG